MQTPTHESGRLARERERTVTCPRCGTVNDTEARWCIHCAVRLGPAAITEPTRLPTPTRSKWTFRVVAALAVLFFLISAGYTVMVFAPTISPFHWGATSPGDAAIEQEIRTVATKFAGDLLTYDSTTISETLARLRSETTASFSSQYQTGLGGNLGTFISTIRRTRAASTGEVKGADITSRDTDTASVLIFVSQTVRSITAPAPSTTLHFLELTVVKTPKGWRVDNVANAVNPKD